MDDSVNFRSTEAGNNPTIVKGGNKNGLIYNQLRRRDVSGFNPQSSNILTNNDESFISKAHGGPLQPSTLQYMNNSNDA